MAKLCLRHRTTYTYLEDDRVLHQVSASQIIVMQMTQRKREVRGLFMWTVKSIIRSEQIREYPMHRDFQQSQTMAKLPPVKAKLKKFPRIFDLHAPLDPCNVGGINEMPYPLPGTMWAQCFICQISPPYGWSIWPYDITTCITPSLYTHCTHMVMAEKRCQYVLEKEKDLLFSVLKRTGQLRKVQLCVHMLACWRMLSMLQRTMRL